MTLSCNDACRYKSANNVMKSTVTKEKLNCIEISRSSVSIFRDQRFLSSDSSLRLLSLGRLASRLYVFEEESCNDASRYESADFNVMKSTVTKEKEKFKYKKSRLLSHTCGIRKTTFYCYLHDSFGHCFLRCQVSEHRKLHAVTLRTAVSTRKHVQLNLGLYHK